MEYKVGGASHFLGMDDRKDSVAGPLLSTYLMELSAETSAERNLWLATLRKRNQRSQKKQRENMKDFKRTKHIYITIILYWAPTKPTALKPAPHCT